MKVFLTGANGWVGSAVAQDLLAAGHTVTGLVRTPQKAAAIAAAGITPLLGALTDLDLLRTAAHTADGVIHTAFGLDLSKIEELAAEDRQAIETFGHVFAGSHRPIVVTSGVGLLPPGETLTENARPPHIPGFPRVSEQTAFALAERGLRACVIRLPRSVHGAGERHGFVPMLAAIARERGFSAYVEDGHNLWPSVHRRDAARVYRLALEHAQPGAFHAIAEPGVPFRHIAGAIGRQLGLPTQALSAEQAKTHFGPLAMWVGGNGPASSEHTRAALGWNPEHPGLIADIERPDYSGPPHPPAA